MCKIVINIRIIKLKANHINISVAGNEPFVLELSFFCFDATEFQLHSLLKLF